MSQPSISTIIDLGTVITEEQDFLNVVKEFEVTTGSSANTKVTNLGGKRRIFTVEGIHTGEGYSGSTVEDQLQNFILNFETWVDQVPFQQNRVYTNSFGTTYNVMCVNFRWQRPNVGNRLLYTLTLIEGTPIGGGGS